MKVVVIGSGAYGVAAAWAFQARGHEVMVIEKGLFAAGATALGAGLITRQCRDIADAALVEESQKFFEQLENPYAGKLEVRVEGMLRLAFSETNALALDDETLRLRGAGFDVRILNAAAVKKLAPETSLAGLLAASHDPRAAYGDPYGYVYLGSAILASKGVVLRTRTGVNRLLRAGDRVTGVELANGETISTDLTVLAAGAGSAAIAAASGLPLPAKAYRTQAAVLELGWPFPLMVHDMDSGLCFRREGKNHLLVGGGAELVASDPERWNSRADETFLGSIPEKLTALVPRSAQAGLMRGWAGLCVATPDGYPLFGPYPGVEGLALLAGDNGFGFMRAPALGEALACVMLGETSPHDLARHLATRFAGRMGRDFKITPGFNPPLP